MSDFDWPRLLNRLIGGGDVSRAEAHAAMGEVMAGTATEAQTAAFIVAIRAKGDRWVFPVSYYPEIHLFHS